MESITYKPIGIIHSPYTTRKDTPIQGRYCPEDIVAEIEVFSEYSDGLKDIEGFSHLYLLYHFHKSEGWKHHQTPYLDDTPRGIFSIRSPNRPNGIGLSVVRLLERNNNILSVSEIDILDGSPLLDIKPFIPEFERIKDLRLGWIEDKLQNRDINDFLAGK